MTNFYAFCFFVIVLCAVSAADITIDSEMKHFVDASGRVRVFHGVNAVYKLHPFLPTMEGFDADNSLWDEDFELLRNHGMQFIRLGVLWQAVEPVKGQYNDTYL